MKSKKKKLLIAAGALALLAIGAGTFAWFTSNDSVKNKFEGELASSNDIQIVETYTPEKNWSPGEDVHKSVAVANVSEYDALIRVSFDEALQKLVDVNEIYYNGTAYTWASGTNKGQTATPAKATIVPSKSNYASSGYTEVTANLTAAVADITVDSVAYSFKMYEKQTKMATAPGESNEYSYVGQWQAANGNKAKAYIGNTSGLVERNDTGKLTLKTPPVLCVIDKTYGPATTANWTNPVYAKPNPGGDIAIYSAQVDNAIQLKFANITATPTANNWYFNSTDGFFYYCGKVVSGAQSAQLLNSVTLLGSADNSYSLLQFDLNVNAEGIQTVKAAITDTWTGVAANAPLKTLLEGLCDY